MTTQRHDPAEVRECRSCGEIVPVDGPCPYCSPEALEERINRLRSRLRTERDPKWKNKILEELASVVRARALLERRRTDA